MHVMTKRKAEGPPIIESEPEIIENSPNPVEEWPAAEGKPTAGFTVEGIHQGVTAESHVAPAQPTLAPGPVLEDDTFWALLALLGYEVW